MYMGIYITGKVVIFFCGLGGCRFWVGLGVNGDVFVFFGWSDLNL